MKQTVSIEIAGAKYRVTTDADPAHLEHLAGVVNARVAELGPKALRTISAAQLLALVAIGLAEDLERSEARRTALETATRRAVNGAIERIDRRLAALDAAEPESR